jgi:hypothetical protein
MVSTAVAKRDWFLKSSDLATLPRSGGGAAWGFGRFPTYYSVKDLDRLAHGGAAGFARKKDARKRRLENKDQKLKAKHVAKKQRTPKPVKRGRRRSGGSARVWKTTGEISVWKQVVDSQRRAGRGARRR